MTNELAVRNRQRVRKIDLRLLRSIALTCLEEMLRLEFEIGIELVSGAQMARINERYLRHHGSTDVITFDYLEAPQKSLVRGDIYVCVDEAVAQAKQFRTSWQQELVRYIVHGILHLHGYDDRTPRARTSMKRVEDRLVAGLTARFSLRSLQPANRRSHG